MAIRDWPFTRILLLWAGVLLLWLPSAIFFTPVWVFLPLKGSLLYALVVLTLSVLLLVVTAKWIRARFA